MYQLYEITAVPCYLDKSAFSTDSVMKSSILLCLMLFSTQVVQATHMLGGYVQVKPVAGSPLTYEVTAVLYMNEIAGRDAANGADMITLCFGDGQTTTATRISRTYPASKEYSLNSYRLVHTYSGPGTYALSVSLANRSMVRNITNADYLPFTLITLFTTNTTSPNSTPAAGFLAPNFRVGLNQRTVLSLAATDTEGDSLVYGLIKPLTSKTSDLCTYQPVSLHQFPNDVTRKGTFRLNSRTGELVWDAPTEQGVYSVAINIAEYRNGALISQTAQEVTLTVDDLPGIISSSPTYEPAIEGVAGLIVTAITPGVDTDISLTAFPNPVDDHLQLLIQTSNPTTATVQLLDVNSRKLHELTFSKASRRHEQFIRMNDLASGVYLLQVQVSGRSLVRKIVKK